MGSITPADNKSYVHQLTPLDHIHPRCAFVRKMLYFETKEPPQLVIANLRNGLARAIDIFPLISGSVGLLKGASLQTGTLAVQAPFFTAEEILAVKDLSDKYDYDAIRAAHFPPGAVDSDMEPDLPVKHTRVLLAQANIIKGGLMLDIGVHHSVTDGSGTFNILKLWAACCRGDVNAAALVTPEWTDGSGLMTGEGPGILKEHIEFSLRAPEKSATLITSYQPFEREGVEKSDTAVWFFSDESLDRLKNAAMAGGSIGPGQYISTNDALCALVWSRVTIARQLGPEVKWSLFSQAVNGRGRLNPPVSSAYCGNAVFYTTKSVQLIPTLASPDADLGQLALSIRQSILAIDNAAIRDKIQALKNVDDLGRLVPEGHASEGRFIVASSWSFQPYYELNWGDTLGNTMKRARNNQRGDGYMVVFPRIRKEQAEMGEPGVEVQFGLSKAAMARLREDEVFNQYVQWR